MVVLILTLVQIIEYNDFILFQILFLLLLLHANSNQNIAGVVILISEKKIDF